MIITVGIVIVLVSVIGGYVLEKGNLSVLLQPVELLIIGGAAVGGFLIATPTKMIKGVLLAFMHLFVGKAYSKSDYVDTLSLLNGLFYKIRQEGLVSVESDVDQPEKSTLFNRYPKILKNPRAIGLVTDTLRMVMTTTIAPHELEALIDTEIEAHLEEMSHPASTVTFVADSLPGLGIVAAVLGVVITMGKIGAPPEVLGHSIGAALVGTFLGVLLCYGFVGPMGRNMEHTVAEEIQHLQVYKAALIAFIGGAAPKVAVEFGRRVIPAQDKPSFLEVETALRKAKR